MFPHAVDRIIPGLQRQATVQPSSELTINWEAGKAARDLSLVWSTAQLDELCRQIEDGGPTRMTEAEKHTLWGTDNVPRTISIPDDPAAAAAQLWLFWGVTPTKLSRLRAEMRRRIRGFDRFHTTNIFCGTTGIAVKSLPRDLLWVSIG